MEIATSRASRRLFLVLGPAVVFLADLALPAPARAIEVDSSRLKRHYGVEVSPAPPSAAYDRARAVALVERAFLDFGARHGKKIEELKVKHPVTQEWYCGQWSYFLYLNFSERRLAAKEIEEYLLLVVNTAQARLPVYLAHYIGAPHVVAAVYLPAVLTPNLLPPDDAPASDWLLVEAQDERGVPRVQPFPYVPNIQRLRGGHVRGFTVSRVWVRADGQVWEEFLHEYHLVWDKVGRVGLATTPEGRRAQIIGSIRGSLASRDFLRTSADRKAFEAAVNSILDELEGGKPAPWTTTREPALEPGSGRPGRRFVRSGKVVVFEDGLVELLVDDGKSLPRWVPQGKAELKAIWRAGR